MSGQQILVISADKVGRRMAGTSIRAYELARALGSEGDVTLAALNSPEADGLGLFDVPILSYDLRAPSELAAAIMSADVVICQPQWPHLGRSLARTRARVVFDLYTPEHLEVLERESRLRSVIVALTRDRVAEALHAGSQFICATERQRDLWIGMMLEERLLGARTYDRDRSLQNLIRIVPFGTSEAPPRADGHPIRRQFPVIGESDRIVLWNGGLWDWFDAPTAIRAVAAIVRDRPDTRLVFMGAASAGPGARATSEARRVAAELGLLDTHVLFNDSWVPYDDRGGWLLEADCAVSTHVEHLETRFAFRTRLLDCFWAGLPIVCTAGDELASWIVRDDLGAVAAERDVTAVAAGLAAVLDRGKDAFRAQLANAADGYRWGRVVDPLKDLLRSPDPGPLGTNGARRLGPRVRNWAFRSAVTAASTLGVGLPEV